MSAGQFEPLRVAVALGDAGGIGPEVALKAIASELNADDSRYILIGSEALIEGLDSSLGLKLPLVSERAALGSDRILVRHLASESGSESGKLRPGCAKHAQDALTWLRDGATGDVALNDIVLALLGDGWVAVNYPEVLSVEARRKTAPQEPSDALIRGPVTPDAIWRLPAHEQLQLIARALRNPRYATRWLSWHGWSALISMYERAVRATSGAW